MVCAASLAQGLSPATFFAGGFGPAEAVPFLQNAAKQEQRNGWGTESVQIHTVRDLGVCRG